MTECKKPYEIVGADELDIDDLASTPDYFLGIREVTDPTDGNTILSPVRVPGSRVIPTGSLQNVVAIETNNTSLEVPEGQVLAGYIDVQPGGNVVRLADSNHSAEFLMLGKYADSKMLIQTTGFLSVPGGHEYVVGTDYYLGDDGQPVTDSTVTGQKLFRPLSDTVLSVNGDF